MDKYIDLVVIDDNNNSPLQGRVYLSTISVIYEDQNNSTRSYIMLNCGQAIHVECSYTDLLDMLK